MTTTNYRINTTKAFAEAKERAKTWGDQYQLIFEDTNPRILRYYVDAMKQAQVYTDLTMREESHLAAAVSRLEDLIIVAE